jgi:hypothetical protein
MPATYTSPKTMTNEPTLYSDWNTYVRDNGLYFKAQLDIKPTTLMNDNAVHQILSSTTETDGNTVTIPAGFMATTGSIMFEFQTYCTNTSGGNDQYTIKFYFGGTSVTLFDQLLATTNTNRLHARIYIKNLTANSQVYTTWWYYDWSGGASHGLNQGTFAVDTASAVIVKNTHKWGTSSANAISNIYWGNVTYSPQI